MAGKGHGGGHPRRSSDFPAGSSGHSEEQHEGQQESAQEMASHLGASAGEGKDKAREFIAGMAGQAQESWQEAREQFQEQFSHFFGRGGDLYADGIAFIRRYPLASLAAAFGIGCLTSCAWFSLSRSTDDVAERMSRAS